MARQPRKSRGGEVYHIMNRGNCRMEIFTTDADYLAFVKLLEEGRERFGMRILAYALMPNHWHLVLWPRRDGDLSRFVAWVASTHVRRWRAQRQNVGEGHLYQGRFKSFPAQRDEHLYRVLRYVEGNPRRAKLVRKAERWRWTSLYDGPGEENQTLGTDEWPVRRPADWRKRVNEAIEAAELGRLRLSVVRGRPFGSDAWTRQAARRLGLESSLRDPGRPKKTRKRER